MNTSPEPVSNIAVSTTEDVTVASVVSLALVAPWVAAGIATLLLVAGAVIVALLAAPDPACPGPLAGPAVRARLT